MRRRRKNGFTLLEVIIALVIVAGALLAVGQTWSGSFLRVRKTNLYNNVSLLLERKLVEFDALYRGKSLDEIPKNESGDFGSDYPQYSWTMVSQDFEMPDLSSALVGRDEGASEMLLTMIKQMKDYISKAVKEIKVTIIVKTPSRSIEYSASTYIVDYNQTVPGGAGGGTN